MVKRLVEEKEAEIRKLREEEGMSYRKIAAEVGCGTMTANCVCNPEVGKRRRKQIREHRQRKYPKLFPPAEFTHSWVKNQRTLGKSTNQMAKAQGVSPRVVKRWIRDLGFSLAQSADPRLVQRRKAFSRALEYVDGLEAYPHNEEIEGMAVRTFPFHNNDLVELIETRQYRGFNGLKRG